MCEGEQTHQETTITPPPCNYVCNYVINQLLKNIVTEDNWDFEEVGAQTDGTDPAVGHKQLYPYKNN